MRYWDHSNADAIGCAPSTAAITPRNTGEVVAQSYRVLVSNNTEAAGFIENSARFQGNDNSKLFAYGKDTDVSFQLPQYVRRMVPVRLCERTF